ncbi:MAG: hypothetical protein ACHQRM_11785 [Bacteroidia bacterium]
MNDKEILEWKLTLLLKGKKMEMILPSESSLGARRLALKQYPDAHVLDFKQYLPAEQEKSAYTLSAIWTTANSGQHF